MKRKILFGSATLLTASTLVTPVAAANLEHTRQLLSSKQCEGCDLTDAGLVMANLSGVNLKGANLTRANLSRANLTGADLSGANLTGASLYGANLTGANLSGANLNAADLRDTYLMQTNMVGASIINANLLGATGLPTYTGTPEDFYRMGMAEAERDNFNRAIALFEQALTLKPDLANAYLGRGLARYELGDRSAAMADIQQAGTFFNAQGNQEGYTLTQNIIKSIEKAQEARDRQNRGGSRFLNFLGSIATFALQFLSLPL